MSKDTIEDIMEVEMQGEMFKKALEKGILQWEDETIQFFLPLILHFTNFDWLRLIAENNLVKEDEIVVTNFLDMVQSLIQINEQQLEEAVIAKIHRIMREL